MSEYLNDFDTLTTNHFLIGKTHPNQSLGEVSSKEINYPKKLQLPICYGIVGERNISRH